MEGSLQKQHNGTSLNCRPVRGYFPIFCFATTKPPILYLKLRIMGAVVLSYWDLYYPHQNTAGLLNLHSYNKPN